jgi:hypothetical protein
MTRRRYRFVGSGCSTPTDRLINQVGRTVTLAVSQLCCMLNSGTSSFEKTQSHLQRSAGIVLSGESIRQVVESAGQKAAELAQAGILKPQWKANALVEDSPAALSAPTATSAEMPGPAKEKKHRVAPPVVYAGADGFMAPVITHAEKHKRRAKANRKRRQRARREPQAPKPQALRPIKKGADGPYKEFKLCNFYDQDKQHRQVSVTRGDHRALGELLARDAEWLEFTQARERVGVADGATWIHREFYRQGVAVTALVLDFFHFSEHVHAATQAVFGRVVQAPTDQQRDRNQRLEDLETDAGKAQAHRLKTLAKEQGYEALFHAIQEWRTRTRRPAHKKAIDALASYVGKRQENMDYPAYIAKGWDIGSGPTESMCKVIPRRVKGHGRRFDADHAEQIMTLQALEESGQTDRFWRLLAASTN